MKCRRCVAWRSNQLRVAHRIGCTPNSAKRTIAHLQTPSRAVCTTTRVAVLVRRRSTMRANMRLKCAQKWSTPRRCSCATSSTFTCSRWFGRTSNWRPATLASCAKSTQKCRSVTKYAFQTWKSRFPRWSSTKMHAWKCTISCGKKPTLNNCWVAITRTQAETNVEMDRHFLRIRLDGTPILTRRWRSSVSWMM